MSEADEFSRLISMAPVLARLATSTRTWPPPMESDRRRPRQETRAPTSERDFKPFVERMEAFLLAGSFTEEAIRFTAVLTLSE